MDALLADYLTADACEFLTQFFSREDLEEIFRRISTPPSQTTLRVNTLACTREEACALLNEHLLSVGREFSTAVPHPLIPDCISIEVAGPHLDIPLLDQVVVVDTKCGEAVLRGSDIFAPGALACSSGVEFTNTVSVYAYKPTTGLNRGTVIGADASTLTLEVVRNSSQYVFVGNGVAVMSRGVIFRSTEGLAVRMTHPLYSSPPLNGVHPKLIFLQNLPSMLVAHALQAEPGMRVLDMCAAPGGKTTHIAALMRDEGTVYALDRTKSKVVPIKSLCDRLAITCVHPIVMDATKSCAAEPGQENNTQFPHQSFDRVLLDPPCSAMGNRPQLRLKLSAADLKGIAQYQRKLIAAAVANIRTGGSLVYSTCTFNPAENEAQVAHMLETYPLRLVPLGIPVIGSPGLANVGLSDEQRTLVQRFDPLTASNTIGFFIAKFERL